MILGLAAGFLASMLGWQINLVALQRGIAKKSRTAAFSVGLGAVSADLLIIYTAFFGASYLIDFPKFWWAFKWVGIATILTVSMRFLFHRFPRLDEIQFQKKKRSPTKSFLIGFVIVLSNPTIYLMWFGIVSFLLTQFSDLKPHSERFGFLGGFLSGGSAWFTVLACSVLPVIRTWETNRLEWISKIAAVVLLIAAAVLIFERF